MTPDVKPIQFYPEDRLYQALYSQYPQVVLKLNDTWITFLYRLVMSISCNALLGWTRRLTLGICLCQVRMLPADLSSFQPPPAKQFIVRQMELMDQGISRRSAFKRVEKEMDVKQKWYDLSQAPKRWSLSLATQLGPVGRILKSSLFTIL